MAKPRPHLTLGLSHDLWSELLRAALPVKIGDGDIDLTRNVRSGLKQLGVRQRVAGLLEDRDPPPSLVRVKDRAIKVWRKRRQGVYRRLDELVRVRGTWRVELSDMGTDLTYSKQKVGADAFVRGIAEGRVTLLRENVEFPFTIEKRLGASMALGDIRYDDGHKAIIGSLQDLGVHLGDSTILQLLGRLAEYAMESQLDKANPVPILKRDQVADMVKPLGGTMNTEMDVEDLELTIDEDELLLKVRFGFTQAQLTDRQAEA